MSEDAVLDASALIALLLGEPGCEVVEAVMPGAMISAVNLAEVVSKLTEGGVPSQDAYAATMEAGPRVVDFTAEQVEFVGRLRGLTRSHRLSLGDRCCLALGKQKGARILTTDRAWLKVAGEIGVQVTLIRTGAN
ncbi:type II toxin-antitoxin system VapC family toxin [Aerophototrophica crusticola]|uniref:Type II toxin-antitoxin system VapC family toxin n=1 Tax=Aerophototrophica crusticola TaxID=1709002 RepID=A0A858R4C6_9PROT|nr:type II toxin-antitoxin system VapC family toxin [Rhodospirillaceae bacterium B3]